MKIILLLTFLGGVIISAQDIKVKGGALIEAKGKANLINQIVIVKKNFTELNFLRGKAVEMETRLSRLKEKENDENNKLLIQTMEQKLGEITGSRKKRSLLPFVGTALNKLFGVATESDLKKEKERLDRIEEWANNLGNIIQGTVDVLNTHAMIINNISDSLNTISEKMEQTINNLERKLIYQDIALKIDEIVNDVRFKMEALMEAKINRVSINLLSFKELEEVIKYSIVKFLMKPLEIDIVSYYNVMNVKVIHEQVYILLPFDNEKDLIVYEIIPFPMKVMGESVMLENDLEIILEKERLDLVALRKKSEFESSCVEIKERDFVCNFEMFYTQHIHNVDCVNYLINNGEDDCKYKQPSCELEVKLIRDNIYIYTKEKERVIVSCDGKENRIEIENVHVFPRGCFVKIINKLYYEPTIFKEVKLNETLINYGLKLNVSNIKLPRVNMHADNLNYNFLFEYKEKVMPVLTIVYFPMILIAGLVVVILFRKVIMGKINKIHELLKGNEGNMSEVK